MADRFRFAFELDPVNDIQPWGDSGKASLHWFGLTSGRYWIETPLGDMLQYTPEIRNLWRSPFPYVDYQVARLLEDLQEHLPAALEQVPDDIAMLATPPQCLERLDSWINEECGEAEGRRRWELYDAAMSWWWQRELDTAYLSYGPRISIWRTGNDVHFRWNTHQNEDRGVPVFVVPDGTITMRLEMFQKAALDFCGEVLSAMDGRVKGIAQDGWKRIDCTVDVDGLVAEQRQREKAFAQVSGQVSDTNWVAVRNQLRELMLEVGRP